MRRRRGRFVDAIWIRQRMDAKDARFARELQRRQRQTPAVVPVVDVEIVCLPPNPETPHIVEIALVPTNRKPEVSQ